MSMSVEDGLDSKTKEFYTNSLRILIESDIPFMVGGAFALNHYTIVKRHTHDLDLFVREEDCQPVLEALSRDGYKTELTFSHWLAKAYSGDTYIDVIFSSGNATAKVDDAWFENAVDGTLLGLPVKFCPAEEMIWSKSFVMERERFDGADIAHLLQAQGDKLDWERLVARYGAHWRLLLAHLILFLYIYPAEAAKLNGKVVQTLLGQASAEMPMPVETERLNQKLNQELSQKLCQGTLLSREQYLIDLDEWSYVQPVGNMTVEQVASWTEAIAKK
jgi:hypothetical protein